MSAKVSRRALARYAADQLLGGAAAPAVARHLAASLIDSQRQKEAGLPLADLNYELQGRGRLAAATVTTAYELSADLKKEITGLIKKLSKVDYVLLTEQVDKNIIGGVHIEFAERTWDKTIIGQLNRLRKLT